MIRHVHDSPGDAQFVESLTRWLTPLSEEQRVELTKDKAVIETPTGTVAYRRYNKPALGPLGDSLDDFAPRSRAHFGSVV